MIARAMISAPEAAAVEAGAAVLARGGNAVDAAVTCAFVQGAVNPHDSGLGGFALLTMQPGGGAGAPIVLDAPALAGGRTTADMWAARVTGDLRDGWGFVVEGDPNKSGYSSICTPGGLRGLATMLERWGTIGLAEAVEPAARMADDGFVIDERVAGYWAVPSPYPGMADMLDIVRANPEASRLYLRDGQPPRAGDLIRNPDLARVLRRIGEGGADEFYIGEIGRRVAEDLAAGGGFVTADDLAGARVTDRTPAETTYHGYRIVTAPAPHCGPPLLELLNMLEGWDLPAMGHNSAAYLLRVGAAMQAMFADRSAFLGDPAFVDVPQDLILSKERAAWWRDRIEAGAPIHARPVPAEAPGTTHVSVVDAAGTCVSLTHSLGGSSGVISPGLGFMYNNSMFGFDPRPGHPNSIAPGKGRITGMTPTIVYRGDDPILVIGAPGATRIVTAIAQVIVNHVDFGMSLPEAVLAPRFHAQGDAFATQVRILQRVVDEVRRHHPVTRSPGAHGGFAFVHAIGIDPVTRRLTGAADAGSDGMAIGIGV
jgi:gamma-glutamyltranspeptidase/glutathione hydrolase